MAQIRWQDSAKKHLRQIFDYYYDHASAAVALSVRGTILEYVERLQDFPLYGKQDVLFSTENVQYYFLVVRWRRRTYKVYYQFENDVCSILAIWDCSMNPGNLQDWLFEYYSN